MICIGCDKDFRAEDCAPAIRYMDREFGLACRRCITLWIKQGFFYKQWPFWARKEGIDQMGIN